MVEERKTRANPSPKKKLQKIEDQGLVMTGKARGIATIENFLSKTPDTMCTTHNDLQILPCCMDPLVYAETIKPGDSELSGVSEEDQKAHLSQS